MAPETCERCGFDSAEWNDQDTVRTIGLAHRLFVYWLEGLAPAMANDRPTADVWSVSEYLNHTRETFFALRALVETALDHPGTDLGPAIDPSPPGEHRVRDPDECVDEIALEVALFADRLKDLDESCWDSAVVIGRRKRDVRWASRHAVHDLWHHLIDVADIREGLGDGPKHQAGSLAQINVSGGGVPKNPVAAAIIGPRGIDVDSQDLRAHHGRPWQALCLWSGDVIDALVEEGHELFPGAAGENLTITGVDWGQIRSGAVVEVGEMRCRISAPSQPCTKVGRWFSDRDSTRIEHERYPGWSRWYAAVERIGEIAAGDPVVVR